MFPANAQTLLALGLSVRKGCCTRPVQLQLDMLWKLVVAPLALYHFIRMVKPKVSESYYDVKKIKMILGSHIL